MPYTSKDFRITHFDNSAGRTYAVVYGRFCVMGYYKTAEEAEAFIQSHQSPEAPPPPDEPPPGSIEAGWSGGAVGAS